MNGRCRLHVDPAEDQKSPVAPVAATAALMPPPAPPLPPPESDDELERLRLLQEAAERHAFEADRAIEGGENGDRDASFNRNARLAATLARTRRTLAKTKTDIKDGEGEAASEPVDIRMTNSQTDPAKS